MSLTNDVKRQNININFKIVDVQNNKAVTDVVVYYMVQFSIRRLVRRNIEKIVMSFPCKTLDNKNLLLKPLLITRASTTNSVATKMRKHAQEFLVKYISNITYDNFVNDLVNHNLQNSLRKVLNKIYPLRICEIKTMELVNLNKNAEIDGKGKSEKKQGPGKNIEENGKKESAEKPKENEAVEKSKVEDKPAEVKESKETVKTETNVEEKPAEVKEEVKDPVKTEEKAVA